MENYNDKSTEQKLASYAKEMLDQIGRACLQLVLGCQRAENESDPVQVLRSLRALEQALGELHSNATKLRERVEREWSVLYECQEDAASCDCSWHENLRAAVASGGGVTR